MRARRGGAHQYLRVERVKLVPPFWAASKAPCLGPAAAGAPCLARDACKSEMPLMSSGRVWRANVSRWIRSRYGARHGQLDTLSCFLRIFENCTGGGRRVVSGGRRAAGGASREVRRGRPGEAP